MKNFFFSYISLFANALFAQNAENQIDSLAKIFTCDSCNLELFTQTLVQPYSNPQDKARAIFAWIGTHIRYDYVKFMRGDNHFTVVNSSPEAVAQQIQQQEDVQLPNATFKSRKGICAEYSFLYKKMCTIAGVECVVINGLAKHLSKRINNLGHAWNAIRIRDKWYLIDATWGSGYVEHETFHRSYSHGFFMVKPQLFILNHLPNDEKWQLLDAPLSKTAFKRQPWLNYGQKLFPIEDAQPLDKALVKEGNRVQIRLKFKDKVPFIHVYSDDHQPIAHHETQQDGYTIITIVPNHQDEILIYASKSKQSHSLQGLAKFYID